MTSGGPDSAPKYPIGSVDNALRLLLLFRSQKSLRISDAADQLGVARSTAHRLMAMLRHYKFVAQDPHSGLYVPGAALLGVGLSIVGGMDIRVMAQPIMIRLAEQVGETVHLVILRERDAIFLESVESSKALRIGSRTGVVLPAHCVSGGKALLAALPVERLRQLYPGERLEGVTDGSITTRHALERELAKVRKQGFASNFNESEVGLSAVGVAIVDGQGQPRGALAVAAPSARLTEADMPAVAAVAAAAAREIGEQLA